MSIITIYTMKRNFTLLLGLLFALSAMAQKIHPDILSKPWKAEWIHVPNESDNNFGVYHFRKTFELSAKPSEFIVHVSADNRYKLYVNGEVVSMGPARSDMHHWKFETVDIAKYLKVGKNVIAAVVWQFAELRPMAQMTFRTAFILQGNSEKEAIVSTNSTWKCIKNEAYSAQKPDMVYVYYVVGPEEKVNGNAYPWGWENASFDDSNWKTARRTGRGLPKYGTDWTEAWFLVPSELPQMLRDEQIFKKVRQSSGMNVPPDFPYEWARLDVPANSKVRILIDQQELANAYPAFEFSKGKGATISLQFAEALYKNEGTADWRAEKKKVHRDSVSANIRIVGPKDVILCDGGNERQWESLWYRTFRYVLLEIETQEQPLVITNFRAIVTGYPFEMKATWKFDNNEMDKFMEVGWRTARLCATETYMDCPFYEQLQYVGDTRIQALISYYNAGDDRLARNAILQFDQSRLAEGITQSRFPSYVPQEIPPFSLWLIAMIHDYYRYRSDNEFVKARLAGTREIIRWFESFQNPNGTLRKVPYWNFTDWSVDPNWASGRPPSTDKGESSIMDLQLLWAYQSAAELEAALGKKELAVAYLQKAGKLKASIKAIYWDTNKKIFSDTPEFTHYSQHPNVLAVLTGLVEGQAARELIERILENKDLMPCSIYFKYYLHQAVVKVGLGDKYMHLLDEWRGHLQAGLTTWGEQFGPEITRSDCHAWSAHPNIEFFRVILGIDSDAPNFKKVRIAPNLGELKTAEGSIPHPSGELKVAYSVSATNKLLATIWLPQGVTGTFVWKNKTYSLKAGENKWTNL